MPHSAKIAINMVFPESKIVRGVIFPPFFKGGQGGICLNSLKIPLILLR